MTFSPPTTIDAVLGALDGVIERSLEERSRLGYFAAVYRRVTERVREGVAAGYFDDNERMERLDVLFAARYLAALEAFRRGDPTTRSWHTAFAAAASKRPVILQHLLVGINAHINLDLGIAAAETVPAVGLPALRRDFDRINEILASMIDTIAAEIAGVSPWIALLSRLGRRYDDELVRFSIEAARTEAWRFANELAPLPRAAWGGPIGARDTRVARLGATVLRPGLLSVVVAVVAARESNDVARNINALCGVTVPSLATVEARVRQERAVAGP